MSLVAPAINNAQFIATVSNQVVSPLSDVLPVIVPFNFASLTNFYTVTGSFTPANNVKYLATSLSAISPNFIIFICDGLCVLNTDNSFLAGIPVEKFLFATMPPIVGGGNPMGSISLSGQTSQPYPMAQGVQVNYTLFYGQATIT